MELGAIATVAEPAAAYKADVGDREAANKEFCGLVPELTPVTPFKVALKAFAGPLPPVTVAPWLWAGRFADVNVTVSLPAF